MMKKSLRTAVSDTLLSLIGAPFNVMLETPPVAGSVITPTEHLGKEGLETLRTPGRSHKE